VFEPSSCSSAFLRSLHSFPGSFLIPGAAALMAYHYTLNRLPWPHLVTPFPISRFKKFASGASISERLANELATIFQIPYHSNLLKMSGLNGDFQIKNLDLIVDKKVLLVKDTLTKDLFAAGEALAEGFPQMILGITLDSGYHP
jgi:hypothetical protein